MGKIDPTLKLLAGLFVYCVIALLLSARLFPNDNGVFAAMVTITSGMATLIGAIVRARYEHSGSAPPDAPPPGTTVSTKEISTATVSTDAK